MTGPKSKTRRPWTRRLLWLLLILLIVGPLLGVFAWYRFFREVDQPGSITGDPATNFLYGSIGAEREAGIPYWIVVVLPRIFDDLLPGPGGYASLGLPWREGAELPAGFSKKTVGFPRVGFNCALCHATQYRTDPDATPVIVPAGAATPPTFRVCWTSSAARQTIRASAPRPSSPRSTWRIR